MLLSKNFLNFGKLFLGNSFGQIIALVLYPVVARFYTPEDFSKFGFILSLTVMLSIFATGQFHMALLNPEEDDEAKELVGLSVSFVTIFSFFSIFVFYFVRSDLWIVPIFLFFYCLYDIERMVFIRYQSYSSVAFTQIFNRSLSNGSKLLPFLIKMGSFGLILSEVIPLMLLVLYGMRKNLLNFSINLKVLKKYISFPAIYSFTVSMNFLAQDFPILIWAAHFPKEEIGYFVMGQKLIVVPALVISNAVQNATVHNFLKSEKPLQYFYKIAFFLLAIGVAGTILYNLIFDDVLLMLLGEKWVEGKEIYRLLSMLIASKFMFALTQYVFVLRKDTHIPFLARMIQVSVLLFFITPGGNLLDSLKLYILIDIVTDVSLTFTAGFLIRAPFKFRKN